MASQDVLQYESPKPKRRVPVPTRVWFRAYCAASYAVGIPGLVLCAPGTAGLFLGLLSPVIVPIAAFLFIFNFRYEGHDDDLLLVALAGAAVLFVAVFSLVVRYASREAVPPHLRYPRGRCRECGYDLSRSPGRCPECGTFPYREPDTVTVEQAATALEKMGEESPVEAEESVEKADR